MFIGTIPGQDVALWDLACNCLQNPSFIALWEGLFAVNDGWLRRMRVYGPYPSASPSVWDEI